MCCCCCYHSPVPVSSGSSTTQEARYHHEIFQSQLVQQGQPSKRQLWGWLNSIFNKYDSDRVDQVGANRACAEWLLRCGAAVRWKTHQQFTKDYNSLPVGGPRLTIAEIDATDSAIMHIGFEHLKGCKDIERVVLHKATYIDDEALRQLQYLRGSLKQLQVSACGNVTSQGLKYIAKLPNLEYLLLYDFPAVKDKEAVTRYLEEHLPQCTVLFTYASSSEQEEMQRLENERKADANDRGKLEK
ncbi:hypothetical protein FHG87_020845 [Trinorchestia longiramus]|nr:hypothetical protein FHG87_020845 [Trinorchestia longiramus]